MSKSASIHKGIRISADDRIYYIIVYIILSLLLLMIIYPLVFIVSSSFSSPYAVSTGRVKLLPVQFSLEGYNAVFQHKGILIGYRNTVVYTVVGTLINLVMTIITAYALARKTLPGRSVITFLFTFTMIFGGGMIPNYILLKDLRMLNSLWAMVVPGAIAVYNLIIAKTFIENSIPHELLEASKIDGCSDFKYFSQIVLPLSKSILAVLVLFYAVGHWNSYFDAFLYLNNRDLFPLQIVLREVLVKNSIDAGLIEDPELATAKQGMADLLKYSLIIVSTVPVMCLYPFVQKYFITGVMIGSIKG